MASVRTKIQTETKKAGAPKNLKRGEIAYNEVDGLLYIGEGQENRGQARRKLPVGGKNVSTTSSVDASALAASLSSLGYATEEYVDDKYTQDRYTAPSPASDITPTSTGVNQEWVFNTNQHEWAVTHNLGYYPDVTTLALVSGGGYDDYEEFDAYVKHNSVNDLTVICTGTTTGKLLLR